MPDDAQLKVGDQAPDFELMNQDRNTVRLSDYRGKRKVMLLFYPMDFSPVCTEEHCSFGPPLADKLKASDTVVFGINADHPFSHAAFRRQYNIPYDLLSDPTRKTLKAYGMFAGEEPYNCAKRGTVVIDKQGRISVYQPVEMKQPRTLNDLTSAAAIADALAQLANEFGEQANSDTQSR
jgi:peroxiredoxin